MRSFGFFLIFLISCHQNETDNSSLLTNDEVFQYAHQYVGWFYNNKLESLSHHFQDRSFTTVNLKGFKKQVENQLGEEVELLHDRNFIYVKDGKVNYENIRDCMFSKSDRAVRILLGFHKNQRIYKFEISLLPEEAHTTRLNYQTKTELSLPFKEEWYVASGGRTSLNNGHAISKNQRFAYDFLIKENGYTFKNRGEINKDYYCYEKEVISPGSGKVVSMVNHISDNNVGELGEGDGNKVVIDHGNGEFSILAHFKKGSIVVDIGDEINTGQFLGLCGNSGRSFQPHIHYHLQTMNDNSPGEGLPIQFASYKLDSIYIKRNEPVWGQRIKNP